MESLLIKYIGETEERVDYKGPAALNAADDDDFFTSLA